jgi:hypothetical protein
MQRRLTRPVTDDLLTAAVETAVLVLPLFVLIRRLYPTAAAAAAGNVAAGNAAGPPPSSGQKRSTFSSQC